jgi:carbon monoxide dehydrogenase subunit G
MEATAAMRIGPIAARFNGKVHLSDIVPASSYTITGEGQGGVAGFAKGGAKVHLLDDGPSATLLTYEVQAQVGGKMAQLGARLIDSTAKSLAEQFFNNFTREVTERMGPSPERAFPSAPSEAVTPVSPAAVSRPVDMWSMIPSEPMGYPLAAWIGGAIWLCILFLIVAPLL